MKSLNQYIAESVNKFPRTIAEWDVDMENYELKPIIYEFKHIFKNSNAKSILIYSEGKSKGEMIYDKVFENIEDLFKMLNKENKHSYEITLENPTTFGITYFISGSNQKPSKFFMFSNVSVENIKEIDEEKIKKTFIDVSKII